MMTLLYGGTMLFVGLMLWPSPVALTLTVGPALVAGILADLWTMQYRQPERLPLAAFGFSVPFVYWLFNLIGVDATAGGFWWDAHTVAGAAFLAGASGLMVAAFAKSLAR